MFTPSCASSSCHGASASGGLNLTDANSYAELVGITSSQDATLQRVNPTNPDLSYLVRKLENTQSSGGMMPPGGALPATSIATIRQWITDGAIDDRVVVLDPIQVASLSPMPNATLAAQPNQIVAGFTRDLDATSVNANTFILESSGGDGSFVDGTVVQIAAATPPSVVIGNPQSAVFDLTGVMLADDIYRVRLLGSGASVIMDLDANALDGEFGGAFPSGNTVAGGDFQAFFTISTPVVIGPTLPQIQAVVFTPSCATAGCHTGGGAVLPTSMDLSNETASRNNLVNITSIQDGAVLRVNPGNPDMSYLITKLEGAGATGGQMPLGRAPLDPAVIAEIRQWIADGAP